MPRTGSAGALHCNTSPAQLGKTRMIIGSPPERPAVFPVGFADRQIVYRSQAPAHQAGSIEFPILVSVGTEPVIAVVAPFICEAHSDPVVAKGPHLLDQP